MEMKKTLVAVGSVAAALAMVVSMAGTAQAAPGGSNGISALVTAGTITSAQQTAFKSAVSIEKQAAGVTCAQATTAALASLVAKGTITKSQADAIAAAKAAKKTTTSTTTTPAS
jgi:competence protein ComGC